MNYISLFETSIEKLKNITEQKKPYARVYTVIAHVQFWNRQNQPMVSENHNGGYLWGGIRDWLESITKDFSGMMVVIVWILL